jgi:uncharacterized protein with PIN domain
VLDAYALVAFLGDEPAAADVQQLLHRGECAISPVNLAEAVDICGRVHGIEVDETRELIEMLNVAGQLEFLELPAEAPWRAGTLRRMYYKKRTCEVSLADCFLVAAAAQDDTVATADAPVAAVARAEGVAVVALPNSVGERP